MSILDDVLKRSICPLLHQDLKFRPILWIYVTHEALTALLQCIKSLKNQLESLKLHQIPVENVKVFSSEFLQVCIDLGKNVPSDEPYTLNDQLTTSSVEQFQVKFMA